MTPRRIRIVAIGTRVDLLVHDEHLADRIAHSWARCLTTGGTGPEAEIHCAAPGEGGNGAPGQRWVTGDDAHAELASLSRTVTLTALERRVGGMLLLHAGGLCRTDTGATVVFAAASGTGKTTLCTRLGGHWGYVSDEAIGIVLPDSADPAGAVVAYPKPLSTRDGPGHKLEHSPDDLGLLPATGSLWLAGLVMLDRRPERTGGPSIDRLGRLEGLAALIPQSSSTPRLADPLRRIDRLIAGVGGVHRARYAEAGELEPLLAGMLDRPSPW